MFHKLSRMEQSSGTHTTETVSAKHCEQLAAVSSTGFVRNSETYLSMSRGQNGAEAEFAVAVGNSLFVCCIAVACRQSCKGCTGPTASDCVTCREGYILDVNSNGCSGNVSNCAILSSSLGSFFQENVTFPVLLGSDQAAYLLSALCVIEIDLRH